MALESATSSPRSRLILWLWRRLPVSGRVKLLIAWLGNLRYAVGVGAVILDEQGRVLLLHHTYRRAGYEWGLPGGWAKGRESLEHELARELLEETGFTIAVEGLVAVHSGYALPRLTVMYRAHLVSGSFRPSDEVSDYRFVHVSELRGYVLRAEYRAVLEALGAEPDVPRA